MDFRNPIWSEPRLNELVTLGFRGQLDIHPMQVPIVGQVFCPSAAEVAEAKRLLATFSQQGRGVMAINGRLVDEPILKRARRILTLARA